MYIYHRIIIALPPDVRLLYLYLSFSFSREKENGLNRRIECQRRNMWLWNNTYISYISFRAPCFVFEASARSRVNPPPSLPHLLIFFSSLNYTLYIIEIFLQRRVLSLFRACLRKICRVDMLKHSSPSYLIYHYKLFLIYVDSIFATFRFFFFFLFFFISFSLAWLIIKLFPFYSNFYSHSSLTRIQLYSFSSNIINNFSSYRG